MRRLLIQSYAVYEQSMTDLLGEFSLAGIHDSTGTRVCTDPSGFHPNAAGDSILAAALESILIDRI